VLAPGERGRSAVQRQRHDLTALLQPAQLDFNAPESYWQILGERQNGRIYSRRVRQP
jgi:hypothetical protein